MQYDSMRRHAVVLRSCPPPRHNRLGAVNTWRKSREAAPSRARTLTKNKYKVKGETAEVKWRNGRIGTWSAPGSAPTMGMNRPASDSDETDVMLAMGR
jgi:hypothetical protein